MTESTEKQGRPTTEHTEKPIKRLYRLPKSGKISGVCAGLAEYLEIDVTLLRLVFVILTLASGGFGVLVYLILAVVTPVGDGTVNTHATGKDIGENIHALASEIRDNGGVVRLRNFFGLALVVFGTWLLLIQFFPRWLSLNWEFMWPAILIAIGVFVIARSRR